jgi:peptidoglycan/xylan/chitin deacetylase (PgdA/CDA1 family)
VKRLFGGVGAFAGLALPVVVAILLTPAIPAGATKVPPTPLHVLASSLTQEGQQLVWQVQLAKPFSPGGLARARRALCLLIERAESGVVTGQVCIVGPAGHSAVPRLLYNRITGTSSGPVHAIDATILRTSASELTASFLPSAVGLDYRPLRWQVISSLHAAACAPPAPGRRSCFELYHPKPTLLKLHVPVLAGCVARGPTWVFHGPTDVREVALTFDDGPWYDTPKFLNVLEHEHVPATFFQIGDQISQFGGHGLDRRMLADGDMIGDHTWNYGGNVAAGRADAVRQITEAEAAIRKATGGFEPCLFRAPGGHATRALLQTARRLGFTTIQWNVDPRDWVRPGANAIYTNVVDNVRDGSIVIEHDGGGPRYQTLQALPREIVTLRKRGYRFVTVTQLLGLRLVYR